MRREVVTFRPARREGFDPDAQAPATRPLAEIMLREAELDALLDADRLAAEPGPDAREAAYRARAQAHAAREARREIALQAQAQAHAHAPVLRTVSPVATCSRPRRTSPGRRTSARRGTASRTSRGSPGRLSADDDEPSPLAAAPLVRFRADVAAWLELRP